jgi:hypothetical protein
MRSLIFAAVSAVALSAMALPAIAQEDPDLPGVNVTITKRSYLSPGNKVPQRSTRYYSTSPLYTTFGSVNYEGVVGFERFPLPGRFYLPENYEIYVLRAPDRIR